MTLKDSTENQQRLYVAQQMLNRFSVKDMQQNTLMLAMYTNVSVIDCCLTHHRQFGL